MSYPFIDKEISLLLLNGNKIELKLEEDLLKFPGDLKDYRVGDLRQYLFDHWDELINDNEQHNYETLDRSNNKPEQVEQLQLLYLGSRLNPNGYLSSLNLELSPIFHLLIRPLDLLDRQQGNSNNEKKGFNFKIGSSRRRSNSSGTNTNLIPGVNQSMNLTTIPNSRRGSSTNAPVPAFISITNNQPVDSPNTTTTTTFVRDTTDSKDDIEEDEELSLANSGASPKHIDNAAVPEISITVNVTNSSRNKLVDGNANKSGANHGVTDDSVSNGNNNNNNNNTRSQNISRVPHNQTPPSSGCCIIV